MNVLYTCDDNYVWIMGISVISLFKNNQHIDELTVYLLGENISNENRKLLQNIAKKYQREICIIDVPQLDIPETLVSARWPLSAFTRLFSAQMLPDNIERILYLDCDTIVVSDISELEEIDVGNKIFYGVKDCIGKTYKENIGLLPDDTYVNAGVLLINLILLRKLDIRSSIDAYMRKYIKLINYTDQDILNGVFKGNIGELKAEYDIMTIATVYSYEDIVRLRKPTNYYTKEELLDAINKPIIIHYTTNMMIVRPWYNNTNHPFACEFRKYMNESPWSNKELGDMCFNTKSDKIIRIIEILPRELANRILGLIHSEIKPLYIRFKATKTFKVKRD